MYNKPKSSSFSTTTIPRFYYVLLVLFIILLFIYWSFSYDSTSKHGFADISRLPPSSFFTYVNVSSQVHFSETQGILYAPPQGQPNHFASIKSNAVRGNHRHNDAENSISGEVIILLHGQFLLRIGNGDTNKYEDHYFNICKMGIIAVNFTAEKCHSLKNVGKQTNWFASYYIKAKEFKTAPVDRQGCSKIALS